MLIQLWEPVISFRTAKYKDKRLLIIAGAGHRTGEPQGKIEDSFNNLENTWDCPCHGSRYDYMGNIITEPTVKSLERIEFDM